MSSQPQFSFLVHPRGQLSDDLARVWTPLGRLPEGLCDNALRRLPVPPVVMARVEIGGHRVGSIVLVPFGARHLLDQPSEGRRPRRPSRRQGGFDGFEHRRARCAHCHRDRWRSVVAAAHRRRRDERQRVHGRSRRHPGARPAGGCRSPGSRPARGRRRRNRQRRQRRQPAARPRPGGGPSHPRRPFGSQSWPLSPARPRPWSRRWRPTE